MLVRDGSHRDKKEIALLIRLVLALSLGLAPLSAFAWVHGIAMHGEPKYGPDFRHFDYVNPDAPKGGKLSLSALGTYDSFNPYILKGNPATGLELIYDTLTVASQDEAFSRYGLVAESMEVPEDRAWVRFKLRPQARFHDGKPITPEDVVFTFNTLKEKGSPALRVYWTDIVKAEKIGPHEVKFSFREPGNRELPLIIGEMPVLPRHYWEGRDFSKTTLESPLGSGPYKIKSFDAGRSLTFERVADYWGEDLPVNRGRYNFHQIQYEYYSDDTVRLEAFKAGAYDLRQENVAKNWATAYDIAPVREGKLKKVEIPNELPQGMQAFFYNTRRSVFADRDVRRALSYAFDFEWTNKNLFFGAYKRTKSYFSNSELAARELPSAEELELLAPYRDQVPAEVFTQVYEPPKTDGMGLPRENLRKAARILEKAGWVVRANKRVNAKTGQPLRFEILLYDPTYQRIALPFVRNLQRLGVDATVRVVEPAQFVERVKRFDYDMILSGVGQSLSPGNEQRYYWGSQAADTEGSRNYAGIKNPVVDALAEKLIGSPDRESLVTRTRALDRVLLWNHYVIPNWHLDRFRVAYWNKFGRPENNPPYGLPIEDTWWAKSAEKAKS